MARAMDAADQLIMRAKHCIKIWRGKESHRHAASAPRVRAGRPRARNAPSTAEGAFLARSSERRQLSHTPTGATLARSAASIHAVDAVNGFGLRLRQLALRQRTRQPWQLRWQMRCAPRWRHSPHASWEGAVQTRNHPSSVQGRAPTCQPWPSLGEVACACSALARHYARSLIGGGAACALSKRARAAP